ncbi:MAG: hypothetical protein Pg6C_05890 [Treponemataceae bacterium]|nr:MAG: hypothetical protein Pg6C_05890 [Treponemataceae bacterium]
MFCDKCGAQISRKSKSCPYCGDKKARYEEEQDRRKPKEENKPQKKDSTDEILVGFVIGIILVVIITIFSKSVFGYMLSLLLCNTSVAIAGLVKRTKTNKAVITSVFKKTVWCYCFGFLGAHRFASGNDTKGGLMLITLGGFGIWWIVDFYILTRKLFYEL